MREYQFVILDPLQMGLQPEREIPRDSAYMSVMQNAVPRLGLGAVTPWFPNTAIASGPAVSFPFPQMFPLESKPTYGWIEFSQTAAYGVTYSSVPGASSLLTSITSGGIWSFGSWLEYWLATNGNALVGYLPSSASPEKFTDATATCKCLCNHNNRLIMGGFAGAWFAATRWTTILPELRKTSNNQFVYDNGIWNGSTLPTFVAYGPPFGGDKQIPHEAFLRMLGFRNNTSFDKHENIIREYIDKGLIGIVPVSVGSEIIAMAPIGNNVFVAGNAGASLLVATEDGRYVEEKIASFPGISGRGCVGGDKDDIVVLDISKNLWRINAAGIVRNIKYSSVLLPVTTTTTVITFDSLNRDFWISDGTYTYVLTTNGDNHGLGGPMTVFPTALARHSTPTLIGAASGTAATYNIQLVSGTIALSERGFKHVGCVQVFPENLSSLAVSVYGRNNIANSFYNSFSYPCNFNNVAFPVVSAVDFKVSVTGTVTPNVGANLPTGRIERVEVRYQSEDLRFRRGTKGVPETA